jgi:CRISPR-associated protein Csx17
VALGECEAQLVCSGRFTKDKGLQPIPPLASGWITATDDGSPEFRLALALALQATDAFGHNGVRRHWLPLEKTGTRFAKGESGLVHDPAMVCQGHDPERDLVALVQRRLLEGAKGAETRLPLVAAHGATSSLADIAALLGGSLDLRKVLDLARPLMALNRRDSALRATLALVVQPSAAALPPPPLYALFRLTCLPWPLPLGASEMPVRCDPAIVGRLASGDLPAAGDTAIRRLQASGLTPLIRHATGDAFLARRLALALAFPISKRDASRLARQFTKTQTNNKNQGVAT